MSHKRIKRKKQNDPRSQPEAATPSPPFTGAAITPVLNTAFALAMKDDTLGDTERAHMGLLRYSWGNWCGYAVQGDGDLLPITAEDVPYLTELLFGAKPCELCGRFADSQPGLPANLRWHRHCLALVYALDAAKYGDAEQKKWAAEVIGELGVNQ